MFKMYLAKIKKSSNDKRGFKSFNVTVVWTISILDYLTPEIKHMQDYEKQIENIKQ